jgi:ABC-type spermidine/putrescine transport system permease subunit II
LLEASSDLGSPPWRTFLQVTLPLSLPGVATGCMLVFILLMGEFLIPAMLGGGKVFFIGNALVDLFLQSRNWAYRLGGGGDPGGDHAGDRHVLHAARPALERGAGRCLVDVTAMRIYAIAVYLFLYIPIGIIALFSFNAGRHASQFRAFRCNGTARRCPTPS